MTTTMSVKSAPKDAKDQTMQAPDEKTFWRKMKGSVKKAGEEIAVMGIKSWLAMTDSNTAVRHKAILGGALAYFVLPTDMVPSLTVCLRPKCDTVPTSSLATTSSRSSMSKVS